MSTSTIIGIIVAVIIIIGGGFWYVSSRSASGSAPVGTETNTATSTVATTSAGGTGADTFSGSSSIEALVARGGDYACTVTSPDASGTLDVSGTKLSASFTMSQNGKTEHGYLIDDGTTVYSWSDAASQGVKLPAAKGASELESLDANSSVSYSCVPWTPDANAFIPPTNITFMALGGQ